MMSYISFLLFSCVLAIAVSGAIPGIAFNRTAGLNLTDAAKNFPYRNSTLSRVTNHTVNGIFWSSATLQEPYSIVGGGLAVGEVTYTTYRYLIPPSIIGFRMYNRPSITPEELGRIILYHGSDNVTKTFLTHMFPGVVEMDDKYHVVSATVFNASHNGRNPWENFTKIETEEKDVTAYTSLFVSDNNAEFRLTLIVSNIAGVITYGYTPLSPLSISFVLEINNYPYSSPDTHLGIIVNVATENARGIFYKNRTVRVDDQREVLTYISVPEYAYADGKLVYVDVSRPQSAPQGVAYNEDVVEAMSYFLYESNGLLRYQCVHLPHTARQSIYGTAFGLGSPVHDFINPDVVRPKSLAAHTTMSIFAFLLVLLFIF